MACYNAIFHIILVRPKGEKQVSLPDVRLPILVTDERFRNSYQYCENQWVFKKEQGLSDWRC
jgi:hypothetical protein